MSEKDNIKLKTATLSSRKSSASAGVHVKRKRKIIAKPISTQEVKAKDAPLEKKENVNLSSEKTSLNSAISMRYAAGPKYKGLWPDLSNALPAIIATVKGSCRSKTQQY